MTSVVVSWICSKLSCLELCMCERRIKNKKTPHCGNSVQMSSQCGWQHAKGAADMLKGRYLKFSKLYPTLPVIRTKMFLRTV